MANQKTSNIALCPECDGLIQLSGKLHIGQRLSCRRCRSALVITERKPLELVLVNGKNPSGGHVKVEKKKAVGKDIEDSAVPTLPQASSANCPECGANLQFHKPPKLGQLVACPECDETLEVVLLRPLELNWADEDPRDVEDYYNRRSLSHS